MLKVLVFSCWSKYKCLYTIWLIFKLTHLIQTKISLQNMIYFQTYFYKIILKLSRFSLNDCIHTHCVSFISTIIVWFSRPKYEYTHILFQTHHSIHKSLNIIFNIYEIQITPTQSFLKHKRKHIIIYRPLIVCITQRRIVITSHSVECAQKHNASSWASCHNFKRSSLTPFFSFGFIMGKIKAGGVCKEINTSTNL